MDKSFPVSVFWFRRDLRLDDNGKDASPYFRLFNPDSQLKKFAPPQLAYIKKWVPEYADLSKYPKPIIDHAYARERCLKVFNEALTQ